MKIQFSIAIAALFICCYPDIKIAGQTPGNERNANGIPTSADDFSTTTQQTKENEFKWRGKIAAGGIVEIFGVKGDIQAEASAGNEVEVVAFKRGDPEELHRVAIRVEEAEGKVRICTAFPNLEGVGDPQCLESLEWSSQVWNGNRELRLRYQDGKRQSIRLIDVQVQYKVRVPAGLRFTAHTLRGDITASFGTVDISNPIDLGVLVGNVRLEVPKALNAHVRLSAREIASDFPIIVVGRFPGDGLEGNIGQGGTKISLRAGGDVELRRASPAQSAQ